NVVDREREVGPQHVEGAVHEVDYLERAEDQRQTGRDQKQKHAADQSARGLRDQAGCGRKARKQRLQIQGLLRMGGGLLKPSDGASSRMQMPFALSRATYAQDKPGSESCRVEAGRRLIGQPSRFDSAALNTNGLYGFTLGCRSLHVPHRLLPLGLVLEDRLPVTRR